MQRGSLSESIAASNQQLNRADQADATFVAFELCPFLLIKRLGLSDSGEISKSEHLGSFKSESRPSPPPATIDASSGEGVDGSMSTDVVDEFVVHSFVDAESGKKTIVEYLCPSGISKDDGSASDFELVSETRHILHLRTAHNLGCSSTL